MASPHFIPLTNYYCQLAGPDGTMDEDEFAEILTFYKFNSRGVLNINLEKAAASKDAQIARRESGKQNPT
jgi:hypothetical protein